MLFTHFCRITSPFFILHHPFRVIFTLFTILRHPFGVIFILFSCYVTLMLLFFTVVQSSHPFSLQCVIAAFNKPSSILGWIQNVIVSILIQIRRLDNKWLKRKYFLVFEVMHTLMRRWTIVPCQFVVSVNCVCFKGLYW